MKSNMIPKFSLSTQKRSSLSNLKGSLINVFRVAVLFVMICSITFSGLDDEKKISINLNTSLENSFNIISKISKINIFLDDSIQRGRPVNIQINEMTIKETLDIMLKLNGLKMEKVNENSIIVFPVEKDKQYSTNETRTFYLKNADVKDIGNLLMVTLGTGKVYINAAMNSLTINASYSDMEEVKKIIDDNDRDDLYVQKTFFLSYLKTDDAVDLLSKLKRKSVFSVNKTLNSVTLNIRQNEVSDIERLMRTLDTKPSQVIIEITLLDASNSFVESLGFSWKDSIDVSTDTLPQAQYKSMFLPQSFSANMEKSYANILSNPSIRVINGETAKIGVGERVPIVIGKPTGAQATASTIATVPSVEYKDVGIQLEVTPTVHMDEEVTIKLNLEVSSLGEKVNSGGYGGDYYRILTKNINTNVRLKDGETAVFGGIISDEERKVKKTIPLFGDIPILGELLSKHDNTPKKTEIIMFLTPHIVNVLSKDKIIGIGDFQKNRSEDAKKIIEKFDNKDVKNK